MAIQARVTSTDALESFRAKLIVFINKARTSVDDVADEVRRTRSWLQTDQPSRWEGEIRRRAKALDQAQQELRNAQLGGNQEAAVQTRQAAVNRARQAMAEAEDKLRRVRKWNQNYDSMSDPMVKRLDSLRQFVTDELPKAVAHLRNVQKVLEAYAETGAPDSGSDATPNPANGGPTEPVQAGETAPVTESSVT
jgi:DNA repair exonuclease SbcCD ATPase subunit